MLIAPTSPATAHLGGAAELGHRQPAHAADAQQRDVPRHVRHDGECRPPRQRPSGRSGTLQYVGANRTAFIVDELLIQGPFLVMICFFMALYAALKHASRSYAESSGAHTQLAGMMAAVLIGLLLVAAPGLVGSLPTTALAAVVIAAALGLFEVDGVRRLWPLDRPEFLLSVASFAGVVGLGVVPGIASP